MDSNEANPDLESFRAQWLSDLRSREASESTPARTSNTATRAPNPASRRHQPTSSITKVAAEGDDDHDYVPTHSFDAPPNPPGRTLDDPQDPDEKKPLVSALDHYEEAMEKEAQGNMRDSLHLYRRAYRMDHGVDRRYREKYFPAGPQTKPVTAASSANPVAEPPSGNAKATQFTATTTKAPSDVPAQIQPVGDLIASFASLQIEPKAPDVEGAESPPCPIASLPDEILVHILQDVAVTDVANFARLSLVCKRLAYLVSHEHRIWRRICVGDEVGFPSMHHHWQTDITWEPLDGELVEVDANEDAEANAASVPSVFISRSELQQRQHADKVSLTLSLVPSSYPTWRAMFRSRPRLRFNGCYISTVNYIRTGVLSTNQATWGGAPVHIVTYYRYLRMFRDGTCISLLTTHEPADVVHSLTRDLLHLHRDSNASTYLPSSMMRYALKGRWRLSSVLSDFDADEAEQPSTAKTEDAEGDLCIETEGVGSKYIYRMDLSLRSAGKGARNNKLAWRGFYSYNKLTDDWGEFLLKNDKPYFFSRVKSYGTGE
ncbi:f-box-like domain-containing protein [Sarocladium implicatum]|nr:f-box-like domain-containing protein [Sarocladium implicatum]